MNAAFNESIEHGFVTSPSEINIYVLLRSKQNAALPPLVPLTLPLLSPLIFSSHSHLFPPHSLPLKVLHEAGFINRSLYVLGKVIAGLVRTGGDLNHKDVPFRDSKLTKLLISSLGGRTRTLLVACVTEASGSQVETLRTLKFR